MASTTDDYVLRRDFNGSIRLDAQHLVMRLENGYALNPKIPISTHMRIAEVGTGTAVWLLDVASELPPTVQLDGYDISSDQFPNTSHLPTNVTLRTMDAFGDVPPELIGYYDVVHMRYFCPVVKKNNPSGLIRNAAKLLRPGGYLQWEEGNFAQMVTKGEEAEAFLPIVKSLFNAGGVLFDWPEKIEEHIANGGLNVLSVDTDDFAPFISGLASKFYVAGMIELIDTIHDRDFNPSLPSKAKSQEAASKVVEAMKKNGGVFHYAPIRLLAQKPVVL